MHKKHYPSGSREDVLIERISKCFKTASKIERLSSDELHDACSNLWLLRPSDLKLYLPQILVDVILKPDKYIQQFDSAEKLLMFLEVPQLTQHYDFGGLLSGDQIENARAEDKELSDYKTKLFSDFSHEEAMAIVAWLDYFSKLDGASEYSRLVNSALRYWRSHK